MRIPVREHSTKYLSRLLKSVDRGMFRDHHHLAERKEMGSLLDRVMNRKQKKKKKKKKTSGKLVNPNKISS